MLAPTPEGAPARGDPGWMGGCSTASSCATSSSSGAGESWASMGVTAHMGDRPASSIFCSIRSAAADISAMAARWDGTRIRLKSCSMLPRELMRWRERGREGTVLRAHDSVSAHSESSFDSSSMDMHESRPGGRGAVADPSPTRHRPDSLLPQGFRRTRAWNSHSELERLMCLRTRVDPPGVTRDRAATCIDICWARRQGAKAAHLLQHPGGPSRASCKRVTKKAKDFDESIPKYPG